MTNDRSFRLGISWFHSSCDVCLMELGEPESRKEWSLSYAEDLPVQLDLTECLGREIAFQTNGKSLNAEQILTNVVSRIIGNLLSDKVTLCDSLCATYSSHLDAISVDTLLRVSALFGIQNTKSKSHFQSMADCVIGKGQTGNLAFGVHIQSHRTTICTLIADERGTWKDECRPIVFECESHGDGSTVGSRWDSVISLFESTRQRLGLVPVTSILVVGCKEATAEFESTVARQCNFEIKTYLSETIAICRSAVTADATIGVRPKLESMMQNDSVTDACKLTSFLGRKEFEMVLDEARKKTLVFLVVGRVGVGKSSTINSLVGRSVAKVGHYEATTFEVTQYDYEEEGIKFKFVDTPGLCDDLEELGNDQEYVNRMKRALKEVHSLWFVTNLGDTRITNDEKRAIRVLSNAFELKSRVWERALLIFTHANVKPRDPKDPYPINFEKRSTLLRNAIGSIIQDQAIADRIPSVAIDNECSTTPDGRHWFGDFYTKLLSSMSRDEILTLVLGTEKQLPKPMPEPADSRLTAVSERRVPREKWEPEHIQVVKEIVVREVERTYAEKFSSGGAKLDRAMGNKSFFSDVGRSVGGFLDWLFK